MKIDLVCCCDDKCKKERMADFIRNMKLGVREPATVRYDSITQGESKKTIFLVDANVNWYYISGMELDSFSCCDKYELGDTARKFFLSKVIGIQDE